MTRSKYKPYPEYKDTGFEWLGRVPKHWEVVLTCSPLTGRDQMRELT